MEIVEQVISANKKSIYDNCLSNFDYNLLKVTINSLTKCSLNTYMNNIIDVKKNSWILSRLMLLNYHDSSNFDYMEHIIVSGIFTRNFMICILSMDIWLLFANELPAAERINYVYFCKNLYQVTCNSCYLSKCLLKIIIINLYKKLDTASQNKLSQLDYCSKHSQLENEICTLFENVLLNQSTKDNYYMLIHIMQSLMLQNSHFELYEEVLNKFNNSTGTIDYSKFHDLIICLLNAIPNPKELASQSQFKLSFNISKNKMSSLIKLIYLIDLFHKDKKESKTLMNMKLLLNDTQLFVRLISYKSIELPNASTIITKTKFDHYTLYVKSFHTNKLHHCIKHRSYCNRNNKTINKFNKTQIDDALNNILNFSKMLQDIPKVQLAQFKNDIIIISDSLHKLNF